MKRVYDLCFSLGANCSAAHNLDIRRLRPFALPLDWTYIVDEQPIRWLCQAGDNDFENFCQWENLEEITLGHPEYNSFHQKHRKYIDKYTGFRFVNHFPRSMPEYESWSYGYQNLRRRISRLFASFEHYNRFLLVLGTRVHISSSCLQDLRLRLMTKYPGKVFDIEGLEFLSDECRNSVSTEQGIIMHHCHRDWNAYDTEQTNWEWRFLDDIKSTIKPKKHQLSFHCWPHVKCVVKFHKT